MEAIVVMVCCVALAYIMIAVMCYAAKKPAPQPVAPVRHIRCTHCGDEPAAVCFSICIACLSVLSLSASEQDHYLASLRESINSQGRIS